MKQILTTKQLLDHIQELKEIGMATVQADNALHEENIRMTGCTYMIDEVPEPIFTNAATMLNTHIGSKGNFIKFFVVNHITDQAIVVITVNRQH